EQVDAAVRRRRDVEQHELVAPAPHLVDRAGRVGEHVDLEAVLAEQVLDLDGRRLVAVDDEDVESLLGRHGHPRVRGRGAAGGRPGVPLAGSLRYSCRLALALHAGGSWRAHGADESHSVPKAAAGAFALATRAISSRSNGSPGAWISTQRGMRTPS